MTSPLLPSAAALFDALGSGLARRGGGFLTTRRRFEDTVLELQFHGFEPSDVYGEVLRPESGDETRTFAIDVIDGAACAVPRPRLAWTAADFGLKRTVPGWSDQHRTTYLLRTEGGVAVVDWQRCRAIVWVPSARAVPWYERAAPFRWLFDLLAQRSARAMVHSACVGVAGNGVLLAGPGGAGKTTLALASVADGFDYAADDYCLLSAGREAFAVYSSAKLKPGAAILPAGLALEQSTAAGAKQVLDLSTTSSASLADRLRLSAIVVPRIGSSETRLERIAPQEALHQILSSTIAQTEADPAMLVSFVGHLVRGIPAWRLHMTRNLQHSVDRLRSLLNQQKEVA